MSLKERIIELFRKGFKDKTNLFITSIFLLTMVAVIFSLKTLFNVQSTTNPSSWLNQYSISFNAELFRELPITAILSTIAGALAAILAIVFAISQIIISNLSERYSPYILERYKEDPKTMRTLFGFVRVITSSILLLFVNAFFYLQQFYLCCYPPYSFGLCTLFHYSSNISSSCLK